MIPNPRLDRFLSRLGTASTTGPIYEGEEADIQRIILLDPPVGDVIGKLQASGKDMGDFYVFETGEVRFRFVGSRRWYYVNRGLSEFRAAARIFNAFSWSAYDLNDPECEYFDEMVSRFGKALEQIEPLGDPATSLWSATVQDTEAGLWTLY